MTDLAKTETFEVAKLPHGVIVAARSADGDIDAFCDDIDFDFPNVSITRIEARQVLAYVAQENELDAIAGTPNSSEALERLIDDSMFREIKRLNREVRCLTKIADMDPTKDVKIKHTGEIINAVLARNRLVVSMNQLKDYSKLINEKTKAKNAGGVDAAVNVNMQFNMADMVSEGLSRLHETLDIPAKTE